jgi:hypothetical protein
MAREVPTMQPTMIPSPCSVALRKSFNAAFHQVIRGLRRQIVRCVVQKQ